MKLKSHISVLAVSTVFLFSSCEKAVDFYDFYNKDPKGLSNKTYEGPEVKMGNGTARSWISVNYKDMPQEVGIELTQGALTNLPQDPTDFANETFVLPLDQKAKDLTPFDHVVIDWNPQGHEPAAYQVPHFDFHFYIMSLADQMNIPAYTPTTASLFDNLPPATHLPSNYIATPGGVPQMGKHWVDVTSPELNGQPFTKTFIYGTYNGAVTFLEPMITIATIQSGQSSSTAIPQPQVYEKTHTWYPTKYNIYMGTSSHNYYITLSNFVMR